MFPAFFKKRNERYMQAEKIHMIQNIESADFVLVGIGNELMPKKSEFVKSELFSKYKNENLDIESVIWKDWTYKQREDKRKNAYSSIAQLLQGKNYFIVTLCTDSFIEEVGLNSERIVAPCGNMNFLQCENNCTDELYHSDAEYENNIIKALVSGKSAALKSYTEPTCVKCGSKLVYNTISAKKYNESGYLPQWERYTKWLQATLNKKLCIIEAGVDFSYPTVIRFPFEKMTFFNQKAFLYRIHQEWHQLAAELKGKGMSIPLNSIDFFTNLFV